MCVRTKKCIYVFVKLVHAHYKVISIGKSHFSFPKTEILIKCDKVITSVNSAEIASRKKKQKNKRSDVELWSASVLHVSHFNVACKSCYKSMYVLSNENIYSSLTWSVRSPPLFHQSPYVMILKGKNDKLVPLPTETTHCALSKQISCTLESCFPAERVVL